MLRLRDYQCEIVASVLDARDWGHKSILATAATGTGKTPAFAALILAFLEQQERTLVLAPRRDLIHNAYLEIRDMCNLREEYYEIEKEMGDIRFDNRAKVVVGCINTCYKETRLQDWIPDVIICDEAHFVKMDGMWAALFARFPEATVIGLTATAMRGDRLPVFHEHIDGTKTRMEVKGQPARDTTLQECAFGRHVFDYPLEQACLDGWLVEPQVHTVKGGVDLSKVKSVKGKDTDGDFNQKELNAALSVDQQTICTRINAAITEWIAKASNRPTIAFCPSVDYAHWAADLWRQAGYKAQAYDYETDNSVRDTMRQDIKDGKVQVVTNYGLFTTGTNVPEWSCGVILRPTQSPGLISQMVGRITRPDDSIAHVLGTLPSAEARHACIASSLKPDSIIIDVVDIVGKHEIATVSSMLGLPAQMDLQGHKPTEAAALMREFEEVKTQALRTCPATFEELKATFERISILNGSEAKSREKWLVSPDGTYTHGKTHPNYLARLEPDGDVWGLSVVDKSSGEIIYEKATTRKKGDLDAYFDSADAAVQRHIERHRKANPPARPRGTVEWINGWKFGGAGPLKKLQAAGFTLEAIDCLPKPQVWAILDRVKGKQ